MRLFASRLLLPFVLVGGFSVSAHAELSVIDSVVWSDSTYYIIESADWYDSELAAQALGGHLVTINSQAENDFLYGYWGLDGESTTFNRNHLWIGLSDEASEGEFVWSSGEVFDYSNFKIGEPNGSTRENHVYMWTRGESVGTWNDIPGYLGAAYQDGIYGIVEIKNNLSNGSNLVSDVSLPGSAYILGSIFASAFFRSRKKALKPLR